MKKVALLFAVLLAFVLLTAILPDLVGAQSVEPPRDADRRPSVDQELNDVPKNPLVLGDELFQTDIETSTGHNCLLGVEFVDGYYYVTSGGATDYIETNYLFKLSTDGTIVESWVQPTDAAGWGWRDLAWDGNYLYGSDSSTIVQISPINGQPTGVTIASPVSPARGLAYDPATDHFWTANFDSSLYEIDRSGTVINTYANSLGIYGLAWDDVSDGGPYLWTWSQDGSPMVMATQIDPTTGTATGTAYQGTSITVDDLAGGADIASDRVGGKTVLIGLHQSSPDSLVGYELSDLPDEASWEHMDVCVPAETAPFAYINQPWDWVEGAITPNSQINATLKRGTTTVANASSMADDSGWFSFDFQSGGGHIDILAGDEVTLNGGGLNETITVVDIQGWIDVSGDSVAGYATGGSFDV